MKAKDLLTTVAGIPQSVDEQVAQLKATFIALLTMQAICLAGIFVLVWLALSRR